MRGLTTSAGITGRPDKLLYLAAILSWVAALIHVLVMPEHFHEWWGYGAFFLVAGLAQAAFAVVVVGWPRERLLLLGILGNLAIVALWGWTRTVGIPFGPGAGEVEAVGVMDAVCSATEAVLAVVLMIVLWQARARHSRIGARSSS